MQATATKLKGRRGDNVLFDNLGFAMTRGEALVITGPNGAGKSTLLRILAGLLAADSGEFVLLGDDGAALPVSEFAHYLGHRNAMKRELRVQENLELLEKLPAQRQRRGAERRRSDRTGRAHRRGASAVRLSFGRPAAAHRAGAAAGLAPAVVAA
jgi:heme exporter protein A